MDGAGTAEGTPITAALPPERHGAPRTAVTPPEATWNLEHVLRAYRVGWFRANRTEMAELLRMSLRTYQRIENGQEPCPRGLLDTVHRLCWPDGEDAPVQS